MTPTTTALVLAAAVLHAVWNVAAKRVDGDSRVFVWLYGTASAVLWLPVGLVILARDGWPDLGALVAAGAVSGVLHNLYGVALNTGYARADLGIVYPTARGTGPLLTMFVALVVLGEHVDAVNVVGGLVVIAGVAVVASSGASGVDPSRALAGVRWGVATGAAIAAYTLWDGHAVTTLTLDPVAYFACNAVWQSVTLAPILRDRGRRAEAVRIGRHHLREIALVAVLSPLGYILVLVAMQTSPVALVAPARESSIVVGTLLAWWLFKEPRPAVKIVGSLVVLAGIGLLAAPV
ncbi:MULTISPECIES: EamA family transporter [unclassified Isoptericola]|uniref:EamA family transporter n=1 Tax=unclassified Isoptericola TaxID=2623355 RepID=UPI00364F0486